ncbi:MAG: hypothetical protein WDN69_11885 [Aliidongia sp.]
MAAPLISVVDDDESMLMALAGPAALLRLRGEDLLLGRGLHPVRPGPAVELRHYGHPDAGP